MNYYFYSKTRKLKTHGERAFDIGQQPHCRATRLRAGMGGLIESANCTECLLRVTKASAESPEACGLERTMQNGHAVQNGHAECTAHQCAESGDLKHQRLGLHMPC